ncbi:MAG: hypothetical protein RQ745_13115 [Longimicrobiales bacterium]|nr:hypothetical protein [Longimicrobiales bacterium]
MSEETATGLPEALVRELVALTEGPLDRPLDDARFDALAREVFEHQLATNPVYRRFCEARGVRPGKWPGWRDVPAVPTRAFRELDLISGPRDRVERIFRTSGTTGGTERRGRHSILSLDLYRALSVPWCVANLVPELAPGGAIPILSLIPSVDDAPDSSLATMVGFLLDAIGDPASVTLVRPERGIDDDALRLALDAFAGIEAPVLVVGTAFAWVHLIDRLDALGRAFTLPEGSRAMETGGFKGRSREVPRAHLYREIARVTGMPVDRIVNEYGMTELLSQFYEPVLREPGSPRRHLPPPWMRTRVLHPDTLAELPEGERGIVQHLDLANLGSVAAVLTEDLARAVGDGFEIVGRRPGAEARGCSLAMEELLEVGEG